jgi:hypothetical protein
MQYNPTTEPKALSSLLTGTEIKVKTEGQEHSEEGNLSENTKL